MTCSVVDVHSISSEPVVYDMRRRGRKVKKR